MDKHKRTYAIVGTGAVGGFFGAKLNRAGFDVHFLLHNDYDHVRIHGLTIDSKAGDFVLPHVKAYRSVRDMPACDVAIVALKTTSNSVLPDILPPILKHDGVTLVLQNGLGNEDEVSKIVGGNKVMAGLCYICSNKVGPGHIRHWDLGNITLAEYTVDGSAAGTTPRMKALAEDFQYAEIGIKLANDLLLARWKKLVWNVPYNGLSVVLNTMTDRLMKNPSSRRLVTDIMREVVTGAASCGHPIAESFVREMLDYTDSMVPYKTSMKIDFDEKRRMEVEYIFGNPLRAIRKAGGSSPLIEMLYHELKFLDDESQSLR
ncbi:MAG: putative 2-dehydropantoate 2-reductase [Chitinivibrionales bacterium]